MAEHMNPSEIARETLRRLAMQRTPPTPDNYRALYHEISGTAIAEGFPDKSLKQMANGLPRNTPEQLRHARQIDSAISDKNWDSLKGSLVDVFNRIGAEPPAWSALIRELLAQIEARHVNTTPAKKREALEHVLSASGSPDVLFGRLQSVIRSWAQNPVDDTVPEVVDTPAPLESTSAAPATEEAKKTKAVPTQHIGSELQELIAQLLQNAIGVLLVDTPDLADEAKQLSAAVRSARTPEQVAEFTARMKKFSYRLQFVAEDQAELKSALLHLLTLIIQNINELVLDDQWLQGQITVVLDLVNQPLNLRRLDDVERRLKEVIYKQGSLKKNLNEAKDRMKAMLATFVERLADFSVSTSDYHDKIERCAARITQANDITQLSDVLDEVMRETRVVQLNAQRSRDELAEMRAKVDASQKEIDRLQSELSNASEMVRHDPLTGALNRKGMDDAIEREVARTRRHESPLCMALLDIDNFKRLNDTYGHDAGDQALIHLSQVVRDTIRPQDTLARYGGEEFVILLPDTGTDDAVSVMVRVQRELTKKFFLHKNEKLLITFSCGVAELGGEENPMEALKRADAGMYLAKRSGKNRVVAA